MPDTSTKNKLNMWLNMLVETEGSDIHIKTNSPIFARYKKDIELLSKEIVDEMTMLEIVQILTGDQYEKFLDTKEYDGAYGIDNGPRFRVNVYMHLDGYGAVLRLIPVCIKTTEELQLPKALNKLSDLQRGLVLITGTTGSGKSTTLAALLEQINLKHPYHVITIEDPIEFRHQDARSVIEQREVGTHTPSFDSALRAAMREDPDVIVVGEIRDILTAESIIRAVNTGHLVFATLHTLDVRETVNRLISIFPSGEQNRVRETLASTLEAVISQRLIKSTENTLVPAVEMMFKSPLIQDFIRNKRDNEIPDALKKEETSYDSITFDQSLYNLTFQGKITEEQAYRYASSPADLKLMFTISEEYESKFNPVRSDEELKLKEEGW